MPKRERTPSGQDATGRNRLAVLIVSLAMTALKLVMAGTTYGVDDVWLFRHFAEAIHRYGPIMVYGKPIPGVTLPYNHPPLTGWMLDLFYRMWHDYGIPFAPLIRVPATLADLVTALLVFELVRARRPLWEATLSGIAVACSPILFIISGYHGNTDPVFVMFTLLSLYLLMIRRRPVLTAALAGASFALGLSVKIVPVVVLPLLLLIAFRGGWRRLVAWLAASGVVMAALWGPVLLLNWRAFETNVLSYAGLEYQHQWGLLQLAATAGAPHGVITAVAGPGRYAIVAIATLLPLWLAWRRPERSVAAVGLALMLMLLLNSATATQYLAWAAAPVFLTEVWSAIAYNVTGGVFLFVVYDAWNHAFPWHWRRQLTWSHIWTPSQVLLGLVAWATLLVAVAVALLVRREPVRREPGGPAAPRGTAVEPAPPEPASPAPVPGTTVHDTLDASAAVARADA